MDILQCQRCRVLLNAGAYEVLMETDIRSVQHTEHYCRDSSSMDAELAAIAAAGGILNHMFTKLSRPWHELTFCDLGAGRGYSAIAASQIFRRSIACEFDTSNIESVCRTVGQPPNLEIVDDADEISGQIDVLFGWHVMEHIHDLHCFLRGLRPKLANGCMLFLQCPCYRPDYLAACHYIFFNEVSLRRATQRLGFLELDIGFDVDRGFISYLGTLA